MELFCANWIKVLFLSFILLLIYNTLSCHGAATMEDMNKAAALMRTACMNKFKVSDVDADKVKEGIIPTDKNLKCYVHCVFEMMQAMKKSKILYDTLIKQVDTLMPDEMKEPTKKAFGLCKDSTQGIKEPCEAGTTLLKCLKDNSEFFTFA